MELDHVFVFVAASDASPGGAIRGRLDSIGLVPSFSRRHDGQGTANLCHCFDNAYLELLHVVDEAGLAAAGADRPAFAARASWQRTGASPFGVACRGGTLSGSTWPYRLASFSGEMSIAVSEESDDTRMPFLFASPGDRPPSAWEDGRAGSRQTEAGLTRLVVERLRVPAGPAVGGTLDGFLRAGVIEAVDVAAGDPELVLRFEPGCRLCLPAFDPLP